MQHKKSFNRIKSLILSPSKEWKRIRGEEINTKRLFVFYLLPLLATVSFNEFIYELDFNIGQSLLSALLTSAIAFFAPLGALYFTILTMVYLSHVFGISKDTQLLWVLLPYSFIPFVLILVVTTLIPDLYFLNLLGFYSLYLLWKGCASNDIKNENNRVIFILSVAGTYLSIYFFELWTMNSFAELVLRL